MWSRADLKSRAKEILKVNYWKTVNYDSFFLLYDFILRITASVLS